MDPLTVRHPFWHFQNLSIRRRAFTRQQRFYLKQSLADTTQIYLATQIKFTVNGSRVTRYL